MGRVGDSKGYVPHNGGGLNNVGTWERDREWKSRVTRVVGPPGGGATVPSTVPGSGAYADVNVTILGM